MKGRLEENTQNISLSELELNINRAILNYYKKKGELPTAAFVNLNLFKILTESRIIIEKPGAEKTKKGAYQRFVFKHLRETDIYTHGEIYERHKEYGLSLLRKAKDTDLPLTLCMHKRVFKGFKKLCYYDIGISSGSPTQVL